MICLNLEFTWFLLTSFCAPSLFFFQLETGSYVSQAGFEPLPLLLECWASGICGAGVHVGQVLYHMAEPHPLLPPTFVSFSLVIPEWRQHSTGQQHQVHASGTKISPVWSRPWLLDLFFSVSELLSPTKKQSNKKCDLQLKQWLYLLLNQRHLTVWQRARCQAVGKTCTSYTWRLSPSRLSALK